jgi:hypothetical protein
LRPVRGSSRIGLEDHEAMADENAKRPTDQRGSFGQGIKRRVTQSHVGPGVATATAKPTSGRDANHPPLARSAPDAAPLRERFRKGRD